MRRHVIFGSLALAVGLSGFGVQPVWGPLAPTPVAAAEPDEGSRGPLTRPDSVSAQVTARASGERVEDLSQGDVYTQVFAEPDGSWSSETAPEPVRALTDEGEWAPLDLELVKVGGRLVPKNAPTDLSLSAGGDRVFANLTSDADGKGDASAGGDKLAWRWPSQLPEPVVDGATATYPDALEGGGDLVVTATATGFTHNVVLDEAPVVGADGSVEPVTLTIPVITPGAEITSTPEGGVEIVADGPGQEVVAAAPAPLMWDSSQGEDHVDGGPGDPAVAPVEASVVDTQAGGRMVLSPDMDFLTDPDTEYPVTIDPTFSVYTNADTWVMNAGYTSSQSSSIELRAGTYDDGTHLARSFLKFPGDSLWADKQIRSAALVVRNFSSTSCAAGAVRASRITESWSTTGITWANQPSVTSTGAGQFSAAYGFDGCAQNDATFSITDMVQAWADGTANYGIRLSAGTETNPNSWRRYRSAEYTTESLRPKLTVNYNNYPSTASSPSATPLMSWTPPGGSTTSYYTSTDEPTVSAVATDADGGQIRMRMEARTAADGASTLIDHCISGFGAQGTRLSCKLPQMPDNTTIYVRGKAIDSLGAWAGKTQGNAAGWSSWRAINVAATVPNAPVISCPGHGNDSWLATGPSADLTCTVTATGSGLNAPGYIRWSLNGAPETRTKITPSSNPATARINVTVPKELGAYEITAKAENRGGLISEAASYGLGYGPFTIASPAADLSGRAAVTTTDRVTLVAEGPTNTATDPEPVVKWRVAGSGGGATSPEWNDAGVTDYQTSTPASGKTSVTAVVDTSSFDDGNGGPNPRRPVMLELQICMPYPSTTACTWSSAPVRVLRVPSAFGGNYPVESAGPGQVALWTGEFGLSETDATEPGYSTELGVSRSHGSFGGPGEDLDGGSAGIFGPGWTASLDGPGIGLTGSTLIDSTPQDGTLALLSETGDTLVWSKATPTARRTGASLPTDAWQAADDDTRLSDVKVSVTGSGASTKVAITEPDGVVTTFGVVDAVANGVEFEFTPEAVQDPTATGATGKTTFKHDSDGRVTRILSPVPAGVTCAESGTLADGCHALTLSYGTSGNSDDRLTQISVVHGATTKLVTSYDYDAQGRLVGVTDERTGLSTTYTWAGADGAAARRLASFTPAGLKTIRLAYDGDGRLSTVTRDNPTGSGTTTLEQVRYGVPTQGSGASSAGLPVLDTTGVSVWNQALAPTYGAAVFPQGAPSVDANPANISAGDWKHASLSYTDADGRALNTAEYGTGRWLLTAADYDEHENVIRSYDAGDIAAIQDGTVAAADAGTINVYGAVKDSGGTVTIPAGSVLTETFGPARDAVISDAGGLDGQVAWVRPHAVTTYDEGAPNNGINPATGAAYGLVTRTVTRAWDPATGADVTGAGSIVAESRSGYEALVTGDKSGWELGAPTSSTTVMATGQSDIVNRTRYDNEGRVIENRQPSSNGTDAGTRQTIYYTAGTNAADSLCGDKPQWAGLTCVTRYAGGSLPLQRVTSYNTDLQPLEVTETVAGTLRRTTTSTYDTAGRPEKSWSRTHGMSGSVATTGTLTAYDPATGAVTTVKATDNTGAVVAGKVVTNGYDAWGRPTSYAIDNGNGAETTATTYNADGDVATVVDPRGTTTYTYDGTDADGKEERRGQVTKVATSRPGAADVEFTGAYDADGTLVTHELPGGLTQRVTTNTAGELVNTSYSGRVNLPDPSDPDGPLVPTDDVSWIGWSQTSDIFGRTRAEWTPEGAAFTGNLSSGNGSGYARGYTFDRAGRLTHVVDHTATTGGGTSGLEGGVLTVPAGTICQTRTYGFDDNGNRTSLTRKGANTDGTCSTTVTSTKTWGWDGADRPTNAGYDIDPLGRTITLPAADTPTGPSAGAGDIGLAYYDDDTARSVTQTTAGVTQTSTYTLDAVGRRSTETTVNGTTSSTVDLHYADDGDNPSWSRLMSGGTATTSRYVDNLSGDLSATLVSDGTGTTADAVLILALVNPHGDIITTVTVPAGGLATGIDNWSSYDEYGNTSMPSGASPLEDGGIGYGWVGSEQRATQPHGLILMGARLYNPVVGQFTSTDPVYGGNTTTYAYPQDPRNATDLDGLQRMQVGGGTNAGGWGAWGRYGSAPNGGRGGGGGYRPNMGYAPRRTIAEKFKERWKRRCTGNSFVPGTLVQMANERTKRIEDIEIGDSVLAANPQTGEIADEKVSDLIRGVGQKDLVKIGSDPNHDGVVDWVTATGGHPFWVEGRGWVDAVDLELGDRLRGDRGNFIRISRLKSISLSLVVYNLTVERIHTYFVLAGDEPVLVHNCAKQSKKSGKEKGNDIPGHLRGQKPHQGESVQDALERILGKGAPKGPGSNWNKMKKYFHRNGYR